MSRRSELDLVIAFRASPQLLAALDAVALGEGTSRSDVARRAAIREMRRAAGACTEGT